MKKGAMKAKAAAGRLFDKLRPGTRAKMLGPLHHEPVLPAASSGRHEYADPHAAPTLASTAGSVIKEFLAAARDGSDLCLPLKAALVGAVKILEICEARISVVSHVLKLTGLLSALQVSVTSTSFSRAGLHISPP